MSILLYVLLAEGRGRQFGIRSDVQVRLLVGLETPVYLDLDPSERPAIRVLKPSPIFMV